MKLKYTLLESVSISFGGMKAKRNTVVEAFIKSTQNIRSRPIIRYMLSLWITFATVVHAEEDQDQGTNDDFEEWVQAFSGLAPLLAASLFVIFTLHLLLYPSFALRSLMKEYLEAGRSIQGQALSSEYKAGTGGDAFLVEVLYETAEHKFADNPSMKFRFPGAIQTKKFLRRFEFDREVARGEVVEVLLLPGGYASRSGCPKEVVEKILASHNTQRMYLVGAPGLIVVLVISGLCVREVLRRDDKVTGWTVFVIGLGLIEAVSLLYCADQFLKCKQRRFFSARPFITESDRVTVEIVKKPMDPFKIPLHEFSGHARARFTFDN